MSWESSNSRSISSQPPNADRETGLGANYSLPDLQGVRRDEVFDLVVRHIYGGDSFVPDNVKRLKSRIAPALDGGDLICWTWTVSIADTLPREVPLTFAGRPIVMPLEGQRKALKQIATRFSGISTMPLPTQATEYSQTELWFHPGHLLSKEIVAAFFSEYESAIGLYLMLNGTLYAILPRDISGEELRTLLYNKPSYFASYYVEYIMESATQTGGVDLISPSEAVTARQKRETWNPRLPRIGQTIEFFPWGSDQVQASGKQKSRPETFQRRQQNYQGKVGLVVAEKRSKSVFATVSSHIVRDSLSSVGIRGFEERSFRKIGIRPIGDTKMRIGRVTRTFDPEPKAFPDNYPHDVSLVSISDDIDSMSAEKANPNLVDVRWARPEAVQDLRTYGRRLCMLLNGDKVDANSFNSILTQSQCQAVGQAVFRRKLAGGEISTGGEKSLLGRLTSRSSSRSQQPTAKSWEEAISRGLLYRMSHSDIEMVQPISGAAICFREDDGVDPDSEKFRVVGFSSFAQMAVNDVQAGGQQLISLLQKGVISFFGAFFAPEELREDYVVVNPSKK